MIDMPEKHIIETFRGLGSGELINMTQTEPTCFNGVVRVTKFKITIEPIAEPVEVIWARIQKLWDECENVHHRKPIIAMANRYGLNLHWEPKQ